jgi:UDP-glucose 4-epimerase
MKILVTGGAGFIGSHVVDGLLAAGHEAVVVDDLSSGRRENLNPGARFYEADICGPELAEICARERCDLVCHHAAQIDVRRSVADPLADARTNILGLLNILENCRTHGLRGIVFASSGGVIYGEPERLPAAETLPKGPLSPYGVSKLASEFYLCYYAQVMGIPCVTLRYGNVYGPRQDPHGEAGVVAIFGEKMLRGETPLIYGDGEQVRDYVFVGDVVRANLLALQRLAAYAPAADPLERVPSADGRGGSGCASPAPGGCAINDLAFNIGTGRGTSVNELFALLQEITGFGGEAAHGPERTGELRRIYLDVRKAKQELGWVPRVGLSEGLRRTIAHLTGALQGVEMPK